MKLPKGRKRKKDADEHREAFVQHAKRSMPEGGPEWHRKKMPAHMREALRIERKKYIPPENCTWCVHRERDTSDKKEVETCAIHGHELPAPFGEVVEDVPGCGTCQARWCPKFEAVEFAANDFDDWFQEFAEEVANGREG